MYCGIEVFPSVCTGAIELKPSACLIRTNAVLESSNFHVVVVAENLNRTAAKDRHDRLAHGARGCGHSYEPGNFTLGFYRRFVSRLSLHGLTGPVITPR